jgi:hypothetical protein
MRQLNEKHAIRTLDNDRDMPADSMTTPAIPTFFCSLGAPKSVIIHHHCQAQLAHLIKFARPPSRFLAHQHQAILATAHARNGERVDFRPAKPAHRRRYHTDADVLAGPPASVQSRNLYPSHCKFWERLNSGVAYASFEETKEEIQTINASCRKDVWNGGGLVVVDLRKEKSR